MIDKHARYRATHKAEIAARDKAYRENNSEAVSERNRLWRAGNREHLRAYEALYRELHPERVAMWRQPRDARRRARERAAEGNYTSAELRAQHERQEGRCFWCNGELADGLHVDHVMPLALGGTNHASNIVLACPECNQRKGALHPTDWAGVLC